MPLTTKGNRVLAAMRKTYGDKQGERVFYASINAGKVTGAEHKPKRRGLKHVRPKGR